MREYKVITQLVDEGSDVAAFEEKLNAAAREGWTLVLEGAQFDYQPGDEYALFYATMEREKPAEDPI